MPHWILAVGCEITAPRVPHFTEPVRRASHKSDVYTVLFRRRRETRERQHYLEASRFIQELTHSHISLPSFPLLAFSLPPSSIALEREGDLRHHKFHGAERLFISRGRRGSDGGKEGSRAGEERADGFGASE